MEAMNSASRHVDDYPSDLLNAARGFHMAAGEPESAKVAPAALGSLEEALQALSREQVTHPSHCTMLPQRSLAVRAHAETHDRQSHRRSPDARRLWLVVMVGSLVLRDGTTYGTCRVTQTTTRVASENLPPIREELKSKSNAEDDAKKI